MSTRVIAAVRSSQGSGTDADGTCVDKGGVGIQEDILSQEDVAAIICMQRVTDPGFLLEKSVVFFLRSLLRW